MHTRNRPFSFVQSINNQRNSKGRNDRISVTSTSVEESSQEKFSTLAGYSGRYYKTSGYKPPWIRGVKTLKTRPRSRTPDSSETDSKPCLFERPSTIPKDESSTSNMYSTLISSEYQTDNEKCENLKNKTETYDSDESFIPESSSSIESDYSSKYQYKNKIIPQTEITCGISRVCRDKKKEKKLQRNEFEFSDSSESSISVDKECLKYRVSNKCPNPCFPEGDVEIYPISDKRRTKIYSILERYHENHCHCEKEYDIDEDPLISLLLENKMHDKSIVRLKDYDHLMSQVFKYIYPSAYTSTHFKYTLNPRLVKHINDLDSFEKVLIGKSDGLGSSDDDNDINRNLRIDEETKFMAAYNAAEMAARMSGCKADEVETLAWMEKDYDVQISPVKGVPFPSVEEEKQIEVIGYVGITRPHNWEPEKTQKSHRKKNKNFVCSDKPKNCNSEIFFNETD